MAKFYYNGVLLPEIPSDVLAEYPYCWIRKNTTSGNYDLVFGKQSWYYDSVMCCQNETDEKWYTIPIATHAEATVWNFNKDSTGTFGVDSNRPVLWSNHDIPNGSATATEIYYYGSQPLATETYIAIVNQNQSSSNSATSCSLTMSGCTVGNMLILAYAIRGDEPNLSSGWTKLGGGNNVSALGDTNQRLYFAYKIVTAESETVTITQTTTGRIYMVCSEYSGVSSVIMRDDLASYGASDYTVTGSKNRTNDVIVYGVTSAYYQTSGGRLQTVTPTDLVKIEGDSSQERLACWFDDGSGAIDHVFASSPKGTAKFTDAVLECVQLIYEEVPSIRTNGYLIMSTDSLYTIIDGVLTALEATSLDSSLFIESGFDKFPDWSIISSLVNPEILYYQSDVETELPIITATMTATPSPQVLLAEPFYMIDSTIKGIESVICEYTGSPLIALSFDGGNFEYYDGVNSWVVASESKGMIPSVLTAITADTWSARITDVQSIQIRVILNSADDSLANIKFNFINQ